MNDSTGQPRLEGPAAVVVCRRDGVVVMQSEGAAALFGAGLGGRCWHHVGAARGARGLPCAHDCALRRLEAPRNEVTPVSVRGRRFDLSCVGAGEHVVAVLAERPAVDTAWEHLTPRELEVLELLAEGLETAAIAARLGISGSTVRAHVEHMRGRLGVKTRAALVARGFRLGHLR